MNQTRLASFTLVLLLSAGAFAQNAPTGDGRKPSIILIPMDNPGDGEVDRHGGGISF